MILIEVGAKFLLGVGREREKEKEIEKEKEKEKKEISEKRKMFSNVPRVKLITGMHIYCFSIVSNVVVLTFVN